MTTRTTPTEENLFELNKHGCTCIQQQVFQISKNKQTLLTRNYTSLRTFKPAKKKLLNFQKQLHSSITQFTFGKNKLNCCKKGIDKITAFKLKCLFSHPWWTKTNLTCKKKILQKGYQYLTQHHFKVQRSDKSRWTLQFLLQIRQGNGSKNYPGTNTAPRLTFAAQKNLLTSPDSFSVIISY